MVDCLKRFNEGEIFTYVFLKWNNRYSLSKLSFADLCYREEKRVKNPNLAIYNWFC
jgi:hypothetical protein